LTNTADAIMTESMRKPRYKAANERERCVACAVCVRVCPREAISIWHGCYAVVDDGRCVGCGRCEQVCPAGIMHKIERV